MARHFLQTHNQPERLLDRFCLTAWHGLDVVGLSSPILRSKLTLQWQVCSGQHAEHAEYALGKVLSMRSKQALTPERMWLHSHMHLCRISRSLCNCCHSASPGAAQTAAITTCTMSVQNNPALLPGRVLITCIMSYCTSLHHSFMLGISSHAAFHPAQY